MKILMISDVYFPRVNGVSTSIETFCREFKRLGHEVTVIAPSYGESDPADAGLIRIPARVVPFDPEDRLMDWRRIGALTERLRARRFDLIHIQTPFVAHYQGVRLAASLGIPCIETCHTHFEEYLYRYIPILPKTLLRFLARRFSKVQCNRADALVVPSTAMADILQRYGVSAPIMIVPTGIDLTRFRGGDGQRFRARHGIALDRPTLIHVGRIALEKNIGFLIEMFAHLKPLVPEAQMIIAGEGPALSHCKKLAARLRVKEDIHFVGYQSRGGDLQDCYTAGDVFVFASATETQGLVLLEAMALGVPVVSTAVLGTRDILQSAQGALVSPEDVEQFAGKVARLLRDGKLRARLADEGRRYVDNWSNEVLAHRMLRYYEKVVAAFTARERRAAPQRPMKERHQ